jgi:hypothetical protein
LLAAHLQTFTWRERETEKPRLMSNEWFDWRNLINLVTNWTWAFDLIQHD